MAHSDSMCAFPFMVLRPVTDQKKIDDLLRAVRQSKEFDGELVAQLENELVAGDGASKELLVKLLGDSLPAIRIAAIEACRHRKDNELFTALSRLVADRDTSVKVKFASILWELPFKRFEKTFEKLFEDADPEVRLATAKSARNQIDLYYYLRDLLFTDSNKNVRIAAAYSLNTLKMKDQCFLSDYLYQIANGEEAEVRVVCADLLESQLASSPDYIKFLSEDFDYLQKAKNGLEKIEDRNFPTLEKWLNSYSIKPVDREELAKYGTDLTALAESGTLPRAFGTESVKEIIVKMVNSENARAIVLLGSSGVGKSAIVNEVVYELMKEENGSWRVLRISPTEFMTGTKYLGEWETRVNNLIKTVRKPCRVIIYIPNLGELSGMGRWSQSQSNVATALAPHIEDGSIVVIGESTQEEYASGVGKLSAVNRLFDKLLVEPATPSLTREILGAVRDESELEIQDKLLDNIVEISDQYLNQSARPGSAVSLLRDVLASTSKNGTPVSARTILDVVSQSTGLPADLLDDSIPLDLSDVRNFFEKRIMGQPEAVEAVIDLLMLIKAGLTDQSKPFGVFLFVGPTGVGKTELARALAEYVFGDTARLQRFDMSEFASYEAFERLIGTNGPGLLTETIRAKPFSVILLDEIEKGHTNVFDLCLQLFDAGRLTDGQGRTVDFRRTIVILTSNIGANSKSDVVLGFGENLQRANNGANKERTFRELSRAFRPEFLNRIDRIVNFRPLSLEVAESIARREIDTVLKRSGITRRNLSVDIDPTVIAALLKEGYSQSFGARPLKRAVEKMLLLPLAKAIATGRISGEMVLRLTASSLDRIDVKIISAAEKEKTPPAVRSNNSLVDLSQDLVDGIASLEDHIITMSERKSELLHEIHKPDFYQNHEVKTATFDEIHKLDQFLATYEGLCKVVAGIHNRLERPVARVDEPALLERLQMLGSELAHLSSIATCENSRDLCDALICVKSVDRTSKSIGGLESVVKMYLGFGERRRLTVDVICEYISDSEVSVYIHAVGLGAYALFKNEIGVHQFETRSKTRDSRNGKEKQQTDREVVRVDVLSLGKAPGKTFLTKLNQTINRTKSKTGQFLKKPDFEVSLFHEPSLRSFQGLLAGEKEEAIATAQLILNSMIEDQESSRIEYIVRYYDFGSGAKIKDARTGKTTGKIDQVLKGNLDLFHS